jgi:hypothetical protein
MNRVCYVMKLIMHFIFCADVNLISVVCMKWSENAFRPENAIIFCAFIFVI